MSGKQQLREEIWEAIRQAGVGRFPGITGRIPNFIGAEKAAARLAETDSWNDASTLKANPDSPQWPVRARALADDKTLYMAVPRLASSRPFWRLDAARLPVPPRRASSIKGAAAYGEPVAVDEIDHIDLVVCGSVAVDRTGARLGKGGGFSDLEFAFAAEAGLITEDTVVATTVHPVQIVESGRIPLTSHDFPLDLIVTPDEVIHVARTHPRPPGILWEELPPDKIEAIPELKRRAPFSDG